MGDGSDGASPSRSVPRAAAFLSEDPLGEVVERVAPVGGVVGVVVDVPDVVDALFLQVGVDVLAGADQAVLVAAGEVEEFELLFGGVGVGEEVGGALGVGGGGEAADVGE